LIQESTAGGTTAARALVLMFLFPIWYPLFILNEILLRPLQILWHEIRSMTWRRKNVFEYLLEPLWLVILWLIWACLIPFCCLFSFQVLAANISEFFKAESTAKGLIRLSCDYPLTENYRQLVKMFDGMLDLAGYTDETPEEHMHRLEDEIPTTSPMQEIFSDKRVQDAVQVKTVERDLGDGWSMAESESDAQQSENANIKKNRSK